jgi:hypothetical protein
MVRKLVRKSGQNKTKKTLTKVCNFILGYLFNLENCRKIDEWAAVLNSFLVSMDKLVTVKFSSKTNFRKMICPPIIQVIHEVFIVR